MIEVRRMKKHSISVFNCVLSAFIFLCVYGNTCYRSALSGKGGADFKQQVFLCFYFAIGLIISIYCICAKPYYSNKSLWVGAIYNALYPLLILTVSLYAFISKWKIDSINRLYWLCNIIPVLISGLYVYAALKKD